MLPDRAADLLDPPARHVDLDAGGAQGSGATSGVVEEGRSDAEDALGVLLVIDGVTASADHLQVSEQRVEGGDRVTAVGHQAGLRHHLSDLVIRQLGKDRLPGARDVWHLATSERGVEPHGTRSVHPLDEDRSPPVGDSSPRRHPRRIGQLL